MSQSIFIVEDEQDIISNLEYNLMQEGFAVRSSTKGLVALELMEKEALPDLVLLDLMLPDIPGTEVCRRLRQTDRTRNVPVLMLTAKGEEIDRVVGFEVGADDYITKPFSIRELILRIRAILRRSTGGEQEEEQMITFGMLRIDTGAHRVWVHGEEIRLTALEFKLLTTFLSRKGRVQKRETLLNDVWGIHADVMTRTVDTHVKRLREKLGEAGQYIETLRGVGYRFRATVDDHAAPSS